MKKAKGKNLPKDWERKLWPQFINYVVRSKDDKGAARLVGALLGELGRDHVMRRFTAALMLRDGQTYREVRDALGLSYNTIRALVIGLEKGEYVAWQKTERAYKKKQTISVSEAGSSKKDAIDSVFMDLLLLKVDPGARWRFLNR